MKIKRLKGFSFFELLIVISLILILVITSVIIIPTQIIKAKDAKIKAHLHQIYMSLEDYYDSNNSFPDSFPNCGQPLINNGHIYMPSIPCDPFNNSNYFYQSGSDTYGKWFKVYAKLRNLQDSIISLVGCSNGCGPNCEYNYGVSSTNTLIDRCSPPPIQFACSPGGGSTGTCEQYDDPVLSQCPKVYVNDSTCNNECSVPSNRCKNNSGKTHEQELL